MKLSFEWNLLHSCGQVGKIRVASDLSSCFRIAKCRSWKLSRQFLDETKKKCAWKVADAKFHFVCKIKSATSRPAVADNLQYGTQTYHSTFQSSEIRVSWSIFLHKFARLLWQFNFIFPQSFHMWPLWFFHLWFLFTFFNLTLFHFISNTLPTNGSLFGYFWFCNVGNFLIALIKLDIIF